MKVVVDELKKRGHPRRLHRPRRRRAAERGVRQGRRRRRVLPRRRGRRRDRRSLVGERRASTSPPETPADATARPPTRRRIARHRLRRARARARRADPACRIARGGPDLPACRCTTGRSASRLPCEAASPRARADGYDRIFVAYADCGTGGLLDASSTEEGVARLEGAHCYEVYAGRAAFAALHEEEPGTFYLTDFLVRKFDRLVVRGLGLDRHPELLPLYFGNYRRLVYLAQTDDPRSDRRGEAAAARLGLRSSRPAGFERRRDPASPASLAPSGARGCRR